MFSEVFVCPQGGLSLYPGVSVHGGVCGGGSLFRGSPCRRWGGLCCGGWGVSLVGVGSLCSGVGGSLFGGWRSLSKGSLSIGVSVQGGSLSRGVSVQCVSIFDPLYGNEQAVGILLECILV